MPSVISVENLGKRYYLSHQKRQDTLRDTLAQKVRGLFGGTAGPAGTEEFWALREVSFQVNQGDVVGIIGRNGAGKSTLLKILSRITEPTTGKVRLRGRVASLLEVGTGFHPELSGRENIFLNGAILGMSRAEIARKFDEIVAFAEVERFLDTQVKHYSSGMYVRLAFAVAAHLEPEILIVDEVLAVGDAQFQKKCLNKLKQVTTNEGRTVLFVSHDLAAITTLTSRCLYLNKGRLVFDNQTTKTVAEYYKESGNSSLQYEAPLRTDGLPQVRRVRLVTSEPGNVQAAGRPFEVQIELAHPQPVTGACLSFQIINHLQQPATHVWVYDADTAFARHSGGTRLVCKIPQVRLNVGQYSLRIYFSEPPGGRTFEVLEQICPFEVVRLGETTLWGWRPDACVYHEDATWNTHEA